MATHLRVKLELLDDDGSGKVAGELWGESFSIVEGLVLQTLDLYGRLIDPKIEVVRSYRLAGADFRPPAVEVES